MNSSNNTLLKPPVIMAIFQLKISPNRDVKFSNLIANDENIKRIFPQRSDNYHSHLGLGTIAPGISTIKVKADTKINSYTYFSEDKKEKFIIDTDSVTYITENIYTGWESFKKKIFTCVHLIWEQLQEYDIDRTSVRFVNKFTIDSFMNPLDYFTKTISSSTEEIIYPLNKYTFRLFLEIPEFDSVSIVNHALEPTEIKDRVEYFLDIDALCLEKIPIKWEAIEDKLEKLHEVKNNIFFDSLTDKTKELCN
ncbi:TIGR04255 family protein [uncultured Butyricimonas sp.]|uniref:TIGR04255 family protein n=1 Tax=uncultured Butyricimonas sp. TaxID=1268785 RepID=UPI0026DD76E5|nr:TIGR04255 family protein [uncultured Butyricimonas sp.]